MKRTAVGVRALAEGQEQEAGEEQEQGRAALTGHGERPAAA